MVENSAIDVPTDVKESLTYEVSLEENSLKMDYYYGKTALGSSTQEASPELLQAAETFQLQERQSQQSTSAEDSQGKEDSLNGFWGEIGGKFHQLPSWKYPALFLLAAAFIFYIVTLVIKIKRSIRRRKRRKLRKQRERKNQ